MIRRVLAVALAVAVVVLLVVSLSTGPSDTAEPTISGTAEPSPLAFAVIGDVPYGEPRLVTFPKLASQINADTEVSTVVHLGDIKDNKTQCSNNYYRRMRLEFERFRGPVLFTPGDNDWADCHTKPTGSYNPFERLAKLREVFFDIPNTQLAAAADGYVSYADNGYPENLRYSMGGAQFAAIHVVGADNGTKPWTGRSAIGAEQASTVAARTAAAVQVVHDSFRAAADRGDRAVVIFTQADMFNPAPAVKTANYRKAYQPVVNALAEEAAKSTVPVYLFNGGSLRYVDDQPLAKGSTWTTFYDVPATDRLRRVTVEGNVDAPGYLKVRVDIRRPDPLTWTRVPPAK